MDYFINDPRLAASVQEIQPPNYRLSMQCSSYRGWTIAFNVPLDVEIAKTILFFRDNGADVVVTVPDFSEVNQALCAWLVTMKVPVFAFEGSDFKMQHMQYRKVSAMNPHIFVDTNCLLAGYASTMYPDAAGYAFAVLETELPGFPGYFFTEDNSFNRVSRLLASNTLKDESLNDVPKSFKLFQLLDSYMALQRKFKTKTYSYDWFGEEWHVEGGE